MRVPNNLNWSETSDFRGIIQKVNTSKTQIYNSIVRFWKKKIAIFPPKPACLYTQHIKSM